VWPLAVPESVVFDEVEKFLKKPDLPNARGKKVLSMIVSLLVPILLKPHLQCYGWINVTVTTIINNRGLPKWLTANLISYSRTTLIVPTLLLLARNYHLLPVLFVILNDFLDLFDGIVARYWLKKLNQDDICLVLDTDSQITKRRKREFGSYVDAVLDKMFVLPLWIFLLSHFQCSMVSMVVLWPLIMMETVSGFVRTVAYHTAVGTVASGDSGSIITSTNLGKTKQQLEMLGSALLLIPFLHYLGAAVLLLSWPLALESVRRKLAPKVMYVTCDASPLNELTVLFFQRAKSLGTKLIVGIESKSTDGTDYEQRRREVLLLSCVDACIDAVPPLSNIDLVWMENAQVDKIVINKNNAGSMKQTMLQSNDVIQLNN
jgi:phosphatidylglycerophosphate synthase